MNRKNILLTVLMLVFMMPFSSVLGQDGDLPDLEGRTVTVAVENAYPPFNDIDLESGEAVGWDYDVINEMCERLNCVPEYIETSWEGMIVAVANGEFDIAGDGITITEDRAEIVDFSDGYLSVIQRLMVRLDEDRFNSVDEFVADDSFVIGTQLATSNEATAKELLAEERIISYTDFGAAVQALIGGDVDAVIIDDTAGQGYTGENAEQIRLLDDELASDELGFIFTKGSDLVEPFNLALAQLKEDGTLEEINAKWFADSGEEE